MGFLQRLLGGGQAMADAPVAATVVAWPLPGPIVSWPTGELFSGDLAIRKFDPPGDGGSVEVVGESHYQAALQALADGLDVDGPRQRNQRAVLLPEPDNVYDPNAVRVIVVPQPGARAHGARSVTCRVPMRSLTGP